MKQFLIGLNLLLITGLQAQNLEQAKQKCNEGDYAQAIAICSAILSSDPENANAIYQRGFAYNLNQEFDKAADDYTHFIRLKPNITVGYKNRGMAHAKLKNHDLAIQDFSKVIAMDAKDYDALVNRGFVYKALGKMTEACEDWTQAKKLGHKESKLILKNNYCK